jgi:hypothetical protein
MYYVWGSPTVVLYASMSYGFFAFALGQWFEQRAQIEREREYRQAFQKQDAATFEEGSAEARTMGIGVDYSAGSFSKVAEPCGSTEQGAKCDGCAASLKNCNAYRALGQRCCPDCCHGADSEESLIVWREFARVAASNIRNDPHRQLPC